MTENEKLEMAREIAKCEKILSGNPNFIQKAAAIRKLEKIADQIPTMEEMAEIDELVQTMLVSLEHEIF